MADACRTAFLRECCIAPFGCPFRAWVRRIVQQLGARGPDCPHELIELALAHSEGGGNQVARAYSRIDAVERRRALMQQWGTLVAETP
jgi:hypothetical protein